MNRLLIVIFIILIIILLLIICVKYIKKKLRNKLIDEGSKIVINTLENILDEKTANQVIEATNITTKYLKNGNKTELISGIVKKGIGIVKNEKENLN